MFCKKCGTEIPEGENRCPSCGLETGIGQKKEPAGKTISASDITAEREEKADDCTHIDFSSSARKWSIWCWLALASLICGIFTGYKGIDRMTKYLNGDYTSHNAYVGGDAYNYIINGTHATAFFVLTAMFVLTAVGLVIIHYLSQNRKEN